MSSLTREDRERALYNILKDIVKERLQEDIDTRRGF